jgi:hypothetical protein
MLTAGARFSVDTEAGRLYAAGPGPIEPSERDLRNLPAPNPQAEEEEKLEVGCLPKDESPA